MHVLKKNPVWNFDATGSVIVHIPGQKKPLLYSLVMHDTEESLKNVSLFKRHFNDVLEKHEVELKNLAVSDCPQNEYYCPEFFHIIQNYIHIIPLWTGIMIKNWESLNVKYKGLIKTSRQDNQKVENWFDQIENHIILQKEVQPSELTLLVHQKLDAIYEETM